MGKPTRRLSDVIEEAVKSFEAQGFAPNTIRSGRSAFDSFLGHFGNIQLRYLDSTKVDGYFGSLLDRGFAINTMNGRRAWMRKLIAFALRMHYIDHDPVGHIRQFKNRAPKKRLRVPVGDFEHLLEVAPGDNARIFTALGLYQMHRAGEIVALKIGDVHLDEGVLTKTNFKSGFNDDLPICSELDYELRRWLKIYAEDCGELDPEWYLVPRQRRMMPRQVGPQLPNGSFRYQLMRDPNKSLYLPDRTITHPYAVAQRVLVAAGYPAAEMVGEGGHTLRRSGARALYDRLRSDNQHHDGANRHVQAMLGHKSFTTTEIYIGLDQDRSQRNALLAGKPMFPKGDNVVKLHIAREAEGE